MSDTAVHEALNLALGSMTEGDRQRVLEAVNPGAFVTADGQVDAERVTAFARSVTGRTPGAGSAAGLAEARRRFGDKVTG